MKVEFLKSLYKFEEYKDFGLNEFAFGGRSNVGKSSLINTIFNQKIAKTGKTPGKTQCINFFRSEKKYIIADLPGYSYAKVSKEMQNSWKRLVESYIERSNRLKLVFILVDISRGLQEEESEMADWLNHIGRPFRIVLTKTDKLTRNEYALQKRRFAGSGAIFFSSHTGEGKKELLKALEEANVS